MLPRHCTCGLLVVACAAAATGACNALWGVDELTYSPPETATSSAGGHAGFGGATTSTGATGGVGGSGGAGGSDSDVAEVAAWFDGLRWESPCTGPDPHENACAAALTFHQSTGAGLPERRYQVRLRFRGVVEQNSYEGGQGQGFFYVGGQPDNTDWGVFALDVSSPAQTHYLNNGTIGISYCFAIDYEATIVVDGGAVIQRIIDPADGHQIMNIDNAGNPIVVPDVPPAPDPYDGQFVQANVVSVEVLP